MTVFAVPAPAGADTTSEDLAASTKALERATVALRAAEAAVPQAQAEVTAAAQRAAASKARLEAVQQAVLDGEAAVVELRGAVQATGAELADRERELDDLARVLYQQGGPMAQVDVLLSSEDFGDLMARLQSVGTVADHSAMLVAQLESRRAAHQLSMAKQAAAAQQLRRDREAARSEVSAAATLAARARDAAAAASRAVTERTSVVATAKRARDEDARLYAEAQKAAAALAARLRNQLSGAGVLDFAQPGLLARPVSAPTTSPFGMRTNPVTGVYRLHSGLDFGAACGTSISAASAGRVIEAGWNSAYGYRTVVQHADVAGRTLVTAYNHQSRLGVLVDADVTEGQQIGWVGATGNSTGCHLDFEVMVGGQFVNPAGLL